MSLGNTVTYNLYSAHCMPWLSATCPFFIHSDSPAHSSLSSTLDLFPPNNLLLLLFLPSTEEEEIQSPRACPAFALEAQAAFQQGTPCRPWKARSTVHLLITCPSIPDPEGSSFLIVLCVIRHF